MTPETMYLGTLCIKGISHMEHTIDSIIAAAVSIPTVTIIRKITIHQKFSPSSPRAPVGITVNAKDREDDNKFVAAAGLFFSLKYPTSMNKANPEIKLNKQLNNQITKLSRITGLSRLL